MSHYDVLVVGAGLAGLRLAQRLAAERLTVLLVDRKRDLHAPVHTTGIFVRKTFEELELPREALGPAVRHVTLFSPARRQLELASEVPEFRVGDMGRIYHELLEDCLRAGVEFLPSAHYAGSCAGEGLSRVSLRVSGSVREVSATVIAGADGCSSRVARDLGLSINREWIVGAEEVLHGVPLSGTPRFECYLDPRLAPGYLAWVVHDGREMHLGVGGYSSAFEPAKALEHFRKEIGQRWELKPARLAERRGGRIPVGGILRRIASSRGLLVGDAAGAVSPLTAGGLDGALRLSELAAAVIVRSVRAGDPSLLERYDGELFRSRFFTRSWLRRTLRVLGTAPLLELSCALLRTPPGRRFAWQVFFGRGSFPDVARHVEALKEERV